MERTWTDDSNHTKYSKSLRIDLQGFRNNATTSEVLRLSHFFNKQRAYEQNKYTTTKSQEMAVTLKKVTHEETIKIDSRHLLIKMLTHHKTDTSSFGHAM